MDQEKRNPGDLPSVWRARAECLREWGADPNSAKAWELAATELQQALRNSESQTLNLREAAGTSGYSADYLGQLVREGKIKNVGRPNAPRIHPTDLPIKNGTSEPRPSRDRAEVLKLASKLR